MKTASKFQSDIHISKDGMQVNAKSILGVMTLAAEFGSEIEVIANGVDETDAIDAMEEIIESKFNEE